MKPHSASLRAVLGFYFGHWRRQRTAATAITLGMVLATLADIATPIFAGRLVDAVGAAAVDRNRAGHEALLALAGLGVLGGAMIGIRQIAFWGLVRFTLRMMTDIKAEAFAKVQDFSATWHADSFAGSTTRQVLRGAGAVDMLNDVVVFNIVPSIAVLIGATLLLGMRWPVMGEAVAAGSAVFVAVIILLAVLYVTPAATLSNAWDTKLSGALADAITCNATVKSFGAEAREEARLGLVLGKWRRRTNRTWMRGTTSFSVQSAALLLLQLLITGTIAWLWWVGRAGAGDVATVLATYFVLIGYLRNVGQSVREVQRGVNDMTELVGLMAAPAGVRDAPGARKLVVKGGGIVFDRVGFRYGEHAAPLFADLSVIIAPGERVGLVGPSGSGKSTFVRLIQRLHDVTEGQISIDGQDVACVRQQDLRANIAIVPQEPILFHRSLADNIAYARPDATTTEIEEAARQAHAHEFIRTLPRGYATLVGERGVKLSGGERQRVAIARAFLADAPILILDEATSSLDSESEALIQEAIARLLAGRTAIVIAHRLSTVRAMDRILVFEHGRIVEQGPHDVLTAQTDGLYRRLFELQTAR